MKTVGGVCQWCQGTGEGIALRISIALIIIGGLVAFYFLSLAPLINPFIQAWWRGNIVKTDNTTENTQSDAKKSALLSKVQGIVKIVSYFPGLRVWGDKV